MRRGTATTACWFVVKAAAVGGLFIVRRPAAYIRAMTRYHTADAPPFFATIGYVRGLKIGHLDIWCEGKREGGWPCHHNSRMSIEGLPDEMTLV